MTQQEKQLLLKDLSSRLPYGVKVKVRSNDIRTVRAVDVVEGMVHFVESDSMSPFGVHIEHPTTFRQVVKPYLRSISSMTKEERLVYEQRFHDVGRSIDVIDADDVVSHIDWLISHHFDYRGLIPMRLALEALPGMYKTE